MEELHRERSGRTIIIILVSEKTNEIAPDLFAYQIGVWASKRKERGGLDWSVYVGGFFLARTQVPHKGPKGIERRGLYACDLESDESTAMEDSTCQRAQRTTESDTNFTQVQGPHGEVKPLRPAFLCCTATPREAYMS
jgi:hypothetical protein